MSENNNIWFTYKARIAAELRLKHNDIHSQTLLVWYAILSCCAGIITIKHANFIGINTDIYLAILSVFLLAVSMLVANRDYRGRALQMRENHIALKRLYEDALHENNKEVINERYEKLLKDCENHSSYDDRYFRCFHEGALESRTPTCRDKFLMWLELLARCALLLLYAAPIIVYLLSN